MPDLPTRREEAEDDTPPARMPERFPTRLTTTPASRAGVPGGSTHEFQGETGGDPGCSGSRCVLVAHDRWADRSGREYRNFPRDGRAKTAAHRPARRTTMRQTPRRMRRGRVRSVLRTLVAEDSRPPAQGCSFLSMAFHGVADSGRTPGHDRDYRHRAASLEAPARSPRPRRMDCGSPSEYGGGLHAHGAYEGLDDGGTLARRSPWVRLRRNVHALQSAPAPSIAARCGI